jgi:hypothetical protein
MKDFNSFKENPMDISFTQSSFPNNIMETIDIHNYNGRALNQSLVFQSSVEPKYGKDPTPPPLQFTKM